MNSPVFHPRRRHVDRRVPMGSSSSSSSSSFWRKSTPDIIALLKGLGELTLSSSTTTSSQPPRTPPRKGPPEEREIMDEEFWDYVERVLFTRHPPQDAHGCVVMVDIIESIKDDEYLALQYGKRKIADLLKPIDSPRDTVQRRPGGGFTFKIISPEDFKTLLLGNSVKRKTREGEEEEEAAAGAAYMLPRLSETSPSLQQRLEDGTSEYLSILRKKCPGEFPEEAEVREEEATVRSDGKRSSGVMATCSQGGDEIRIAIQEAEASLDSFKKDREKVAKDSRNQQAEIEERMKKDVGAELAKKRLAPLTPQQEKEVHNLFNTGGLRDIIVKAFSVDLPREDLRTLRPKEWLNDEVINFFFNLLQERDKALCAADPNRKKNYFFNSFFFAKLLDDEGFCYRNVKRWSRKAGDLFECEKVFFPVNLQNTHWCLAVIYMQKKVIQYYDSMTGGGEKYLNALKRYLQEEHMDKKKIPIDLSDWELRKSHPSTTPQQANGCDCGVFASCFAYMMSVDLDIKYVSQKDMPMFRKRMAYSIMHTKLDW